jgi:hypothetical protein
MPRCGVGLNELLGCTQHSGYDQDNEGNFEPDLSQKMSASVACAQLITLDGDTLNIAPLSSIKATASLAMIDLDGSVR